MLRLLPTLAVVLLLAACSKPPKPLLPPQQSHEIVVVTYNSPTTYFVNGTNEFAGLEYDLVKLFCEQLGPDYKVQFLPVSGVGEVIPTLLKGHAHFAAAGLDINRLRSHLVRFGPAYQEVQPQMVVNGDSHDKIHAIEDVIGKSVAVPSGSSDAERLATLAVDMPGLYWRQVPQSGSEELLEQVADGTLDATIADSHLVSIVQNYYPNLDVAFNFGTPRELAWAFPNNGDPWLYQQAQDFFDRIQRDGTLHNLMDRYYGHSERLKAMDITGFLSQMHTTLPQYVKLMKQAEATTQIDWKLLAALSYQESHWDTYSTSPTNVRGLMMLTEHTADKMGVKNRLDPKQSIMAGAQYFLLLKNEIPARIAEPDRTWLALASYNVGIAHLEDARVLTQRMGLNPDVWADVKKALPLLTQFQHYSKLKNGFARGGAAVIFVESIRTYYDILVKYEAKNTITPPPVKPSKINVAWAELRAMAIP
jgi:membrane-bound lytic murein transglycosylase F